MAQGQVLKWQTGRFYTEHGQRIAAVELGDGRFVFYDIDRNIQGVTTEAIGWKLLYEYGETPPEKIIKSAIMSAYDEGNYHHHQRDPNALTIMCLLEKLAETVEPNKRR